MAYYVAYFAVSRLVFTEELTLGEAHEFNYLNSQSKYY